MKCIQVTEIGKTFEDAINNFSMGTNVSIPEPSSHQVLIKVKVAALNFLDTLVIQNKYQVKFKPPFVPGVEFSGIVVKLGKKVTSFKVGDRVLGGPSYPHGAIGEYSIADATNIWKMPDNMSFSDGASFATIYGTAYMAIIQRANLLNHKIAINSKHYNDGINVLVTAGAGGLGTACIQIANCFKKEKQNINNETTNNNNNNNNSQNDIKNLGLNTFTNVNKIYACVGNNQFDIKSKIVKDCGADNVINYTNNNEWGKYLSKKENIKFDIICDMVGGTAFEQSLKCINFFGKLIVLGFAGGNIPKVKVNKLLLNSCDIVGCAWGATAFYDMPMFRESIVNALKLYQCGLLKPIIGKIYNFNENNVKQAFMDLANRKSIGKLLINIDDLTQNNNNNVGNTVSKL